MKQLNEVNMEKQKVDYECKQKEWAMNAQVQELNAKIDQEKSKHQNETKQQE